MFVILVPEKIQALVLNLRHVIQSLLRDSLLKPILQILPERQL
jgi:hypothetical protein